VNGGRTCTRFSEPHGAAAPDLAPATVPLLAGEVLGPICSSEAKRSRGATAVRGKRSNHRKGRGISVGTHRRRRRYGGREGDAATAVVAAWLGGRKRIGDLRWPGVRMAGQWQMEGGWVWRVGRPPCGCGPHVCFEVGPTRHSL